MEYPYVLQSGAAAAVIQCRHLARFGVPHRSVGSALRECLGRHRPNFCGPSAYAFLGDPGEFPVAIPEALFKIVIRESGIPHRPNFLAFIYPQVGPGYSFTPYNHARFLTSVDEIEQLTGIDFLTSLPDGVEAELEAKEAPGLWPADASDFVPACQGGGD